MGIADTDFKLFREILETESTSGTERRLAEFLEKRLPGESRRAGTSCDARESVCCSVSRTEVGDGTLNLLFKWMPRGEEDRMPEICLCTHIDTVPPYFPPEFAGVRRGDVLPDGRIAESDDILVTGRGSCDAKGQIFSMWLACMELQRTLKSFGKGFGLLLLSGEETGSFGAKAYDRDCEGSGWLVVGEPTDNIPVSASKGTAAFAVTVRGRACHSGYPELGRSAVETFVDIVGKLRKENFPVDPELGETTWNIGRLSSDNPQNILSPLLTFRVYFRTTFASEDAVNAAMERIVREFPEVEAEALGGDHPMRYRVPEGYRSAPVAFGSDTPRMTKFRNRTLCGPGSIFVAHTPEEYILGSEILKAKEQYADMVRRVLVPGSDCTGR